MHGIGFPFSSITVNTCYMELRYDDAHQTRTPYTDTALRSLYITTPTYYMTPWTRTRQGLCNPHHGAGQGPPRLNTIVFESPARAAH